MTKSRFQPTEKVYGVDPKILVDMSYKDAIILKYKNAKERKKQVANEMFNKTIGPENYNKFIRLDAELRKLDKAIELCELQLEEIGVKTDEIDK